jgi:hypothetical protein
MAELVRTNEYSAGIRRLTEEKLLEYIVKPEDFHDDAVLAAIWELERRRPLKTNELGLEAEIIDRSEKKIVSISEFDRQSFPLNDSALPSLYSIRSIQVFSVLFSVLAGGILMAINFGRTTQKTEAIKVLGFSLAYTIISVLIFALVGIQSPFLSIILNLLGAFLINELFWKRVLGLNFRFKKQQIWSALIFAIILISPLIWYVIKTGAMQTI